MHQICIFVILSIIFITMGNSHQAEVHNRHAPYWAIAMIILGITGISTIWIDGGPFWKSYVLDMTGPAWNYILFRGLFTQYSDNVWIRFFSPLKTFIIFLAVCFAIEMAQYFQLYDAVYDPWDLLAYPSILSILFYFDLKQQAK